MATLAAPFSLPQSALVQLVRFASAASKPSGRSTKRSARSLGGGLGKRIAGTGAVHVPAAPSAPERSCQVAAGLLSLSSSSSSSLLLLLLLLLLVSQSMHCCSLSLLLAAEPADWRKAQRARVWRRRGKICSRSRRKARRVERRRSGHDRLGHLHDAAGRPV